MALRSLLCLLLVSCIVAGWQPLPEALAQVPDGSDVVETPLDVLAAPDAAGEATAVPESTEPDESKAFAERLEASRRLAQTDKDLLVGHGDVLPQAARELLTRASQVDALVKGELDVAVEPASLLVLDLSSGGDADLQGETLALLFLTPLADRLPEPAEEIRAPTDGAGDPTASDAPAEENESAPAETVGQAPEADVVAQEEPADVVSSPPADVVEQVDELPDVLEPPPIPEPEVSDEELVLAARRSLLRSQIRFLALPEATRDALLNAHRRRQEEAVLQRTEASRLNTLADRYSEQAGRLAALLSGQLPLAEDPAPLLRVDLGQPALSATLLALLAGEKDELPAVVESAGSEVAEARHRLALASRELADLYARVLALSPEQRKALIDGHLQRRTDEETAAEQVREAARMAAEAAEAQAQAEAERLKAEEEERKRVQAAEAAERARLEAELRLKDHEEALARARAEQEEEQRRQAARRSAAEAAAQEAAIQANAAKLEAERAEREQAAALAAAQEEADAHAKRLADERARLAGYRMELANYEARLLGIRTGLKEGQLADIEIHQRLEQLLALRSKGETVHPLADALWNDLLNQLEGQRLRFSGVLSLLLTPDTELPSRGSGVVPGTLSEDAQAEIMAAWEVQADNRRRIERLESDILWEAADALAAAVTALNRDRLATIPLLSQGRRATVTGFGEEGLQQVTGALVQAWNIMRYRVAALPRLVAQTYSRFRANPALALRPILAVFVLFAGLFWWLSRGRRLRRIRRERLPSKSVTLPLATILLERIWGPLAWLIFPAAAIFLSGLGETFPEVRFLWPAFAWLAGGLVVVRFVDGLVEWGQPRRGHRGPRTTSPLRNRSLRLIGLATVSIGLLLSLTETALGRGAVYRWVLSTCWLLALPISIVLLSWWRRPIRERLLERRRRNRLVEWCIAHNQSGKLTWLADSLGGLYLLGSGLADWSLRWLGTLKVARRIHAWLFRRQVARQARLQVAEKLAPLPESIAARILSPPEPPLLGDLQQSVLEELAEVPEASAENLALVVGNRGMGKTTVLHRLAATAPDDALVVACANGPLENTLDRFRKALGVSAEADVLEALRQRSPSLVCVDDAQLLVRPVVRGLRELDRLLDLAGDLGRGTNWVLTMSTSAWLFVSRARSGTFLFDRVLKLKPWDEVDIGRLLEQRSREAGISPSFDGLIFQTRPDDWGLGERVGQVSESYYRVLWSAAEGNPKVALRYWCDSLRTAADGRVSVRLFDEPPQSATDVLPLNLLFILRALLQIDDASVPEIASATGLPQAEVVDGLRHCLTRGFVRRKADLYQLTWRWFTPVMRTLIRQHLLVP